jgi:hypothetical protein
MLIGKSSRENVPLVRGCCFEKDGEQGFKVFTYMKGREWQELESMVSPRSLPNRHYDDEVLDIMLAGIVLEETKNILMDRKTAQGVISYRRSRLTATGSEPNILVVGAGATGVFVGLGLGYSKFRHITFMDPDVADVSNLNRQVLLYDAIGLSKAETLCERVNRFFGTRAEAVVSYFEEDTDISPFDVVFDCVDNFETRILMSEKCRSQKKLLISGGTNVDAGQVVIYNPIKDHVTPAELLGLYDIVDTREVQTDRQDSASCNYRPDPSIIMTNQIIAGAMVDAFRMVLDGQTPENIFYDSAGDERI